MPELPEVETTRRGIAPHILGQQVTQVVVRNPRLRWPVPDSLAVTLPGKTILAVERRAKYLLLKTAAGTLLMHLGMSGSLRIVTAAEAVEPHDHLDVVFSHGQVLRFTDPRRFGCALWLTEDPCQHPLLRSLGPEPLSDEFATDTLYAASRGRKAPIKTFIMDNQVVVGVGNIYANEALFAAGIHPKRPAGRVSKSRYARLVTAIKAVLARAIEQGGTTLRDFVGGDGKPGYFRIELKVYGHAGEPCANCQRPLKEIRLGQRATVFCSHCQR